ncbi:MAG: hypothetical protein LBG42_06530, partial [Treponema sp.]|nr:hypothetical protein [Treponema sp.]
MKIKPRFFLAPVLAALAAAGFFLLIGADENTTVYVTSTGTKYHRENCMSLRRSKTAVSLETAVRDGYEPCGI